MAASEQRSGRRPAGTGKPHEIGRTFGLLLQIEREARRVESKDALAFVAVNRTRRLIAYDQAVLLHQTDARRLRTVAVSGLATVERNAPYVIWVERVLAALHRTGRLDRAGSLSPGDLPDDLRSEWSEWWPEQVFWQPLTDALAGPVGGLLLARRAPEWTSAETVLLQELADCYALCWAVAGVRRRPSMPHRPRVVRLAWAAAGLVLLAGIALPVRQSVIAPAQVAARDPIVVAAPVDGVISEVFVSPDSEVSRGEPLFAYEPAELTARKEMAEHALAVAQADLRRARQQAFGDPLSKATVAVKEAAVELKRAELEYSRYLVGKVTVTAPADGIAVFADPNDWRGRPVRIGERVMQIADPEEAWIEIEISASDAVSLEPGAEALLFLDVDPLHPLPARLERASYEAEPTATGVLAYRAFAEFTGEGSPPRVGLRGSAKVYGARAPLLLHLFRRPISALRQFLGI